MSSIRRLFQVREADDDGCYMPQDHNRCDGDGGLPVSHPVAEELRCRLAIDSEEALLRMCMVQSLSHKTSCLTFRPGPPRVLYVIPEPSIGALTNSASGSFCNTPLSSSLVPPKDNTGQKHTANDAASQRIRSDEKTKQALLDTEDIDACLKQMQRQHTDDRRRRNNYAKVTYEVRTKLEIIEQHMAKCQRDEEEQRFDVEIVEEILLQKVLASHGRHNLSALMTLQTDESAMRKTLSVDEVECFERLMGLLHGADAAFEMAKLASVASPNRRACSPERDNVGNSATQLGPRPPSSAKRGMSLGSRRGSRMADSADEGWIVGYLSAEVSKARVTLECDRDAQMERLKSCFDTFCGLIRSHHVRVDPLLGLWLPRPGAPDAARTQLGDALCMFLEEEENLARYKLEVVFEQEIRRLVLVHRSTHRSVGEWLSLSFRV